jgi:hypothetical protein
LQRVIAVAAAALALGGCLRETSHACEISGTCADDADIESDAPVVDTPSENDTPPLVVDAAVSTIDVGRGVDGAQLVSGTSAVDARVKTCAKLGTPPTAGQGLVVIDASTLVAANAGTGLDSFVSDRRVIVWQTASDMPVGIMIGEQTPYAVPAAVGRYEVVLVSSTTAVGNGTITLQLATPLAGSYTTTAQVCRVPEFTDVTVFNPTGMAMPQLRPPAWNGTVGGLLAFYASGTVTIGGTGGTGTILAQSRGFRDGVPVSFSGSGEDCADLVGDSTTGGGDHKGEGLVTSLYGSVSNSPANTFGRGNALDGGGGGNCHNAGGGGGGNGGRGGRGGDQADSTPGGGGLGGAALVIDARTQLVMGGGGGAGDADDNVAGSGGNGGGVVWIHAASLTCSAIRATGGVGGNSAASPRDGAGGGGAGGMIVAEARMLGPCTFDAGGGAGGRSYLGSNTYPSGPGGGGAGGRVYLRTGARTIDPQVTVGGGAAGVVADDSGSWNATAGGAGVVCGNSVVDAGETCDDGGNADPSDGCDLCR